MNEPDPPAEPDATAPPAAIAVDRPSTLVELGWNDRVAALVASAEPMAPVRPGRVVRVDRISSVVATGDGEVQAAGHPLPAVGDWVLVEPDPDAGPTAEWAVRATVPRWSSLERHAAVKATEVQVLAVNIDLVCIVVPLDKPLNFGRLDRELVVAWESGATPVVVLTKADRNDDPTGAAGEVLARSNGIDVIVTSSRDGRGVDALRALIGASDTLVLLGASGAGKSTLANRLLGAEVLATGAVREGDAKGRHTTTSRYLLPIPTGGVLVDTPGLRGLGLWDVTDGMALAFSDIEELGEGCRFADCAHDQEPGCAVRAAVERGELAVERFDSWQKLQVEAAQVERKRDARAKTEEKRKAKEGTRALRKVYEERERRR